VQVGKEIISNWYQNSNLKTNLLAMIPYE
jgi:hypothetical protein